jgi:hypothetical protein
MRQSKDKAIARERGRTNLKLPTISSYIKMAEEDKWMWDILCKTTRRSRHEGRTSPH